MDLGKRAKKGVKNSKNHNNNKAKKSISRVKSDNIIENSSSLESQESVYEYEDYIGQDEQGNNNKGA